MPTDLVITITAKQSSTGSFTEVTVEKPPGMNTAEVIGRIEQAKMDLLLKSAVMDA